jgi:methionyl-tRNA formyltransferase
MRRKKIMNNKLVIRQANAEDVTKIAEIELNDEDLKLENGTILPRSSPKAGVFVKTVDGAVELLEMQMPGGKVLPAKVLMNGRKINPYDSFKQVIQIF